MSKSRRDAIGWIPGKKKAEVDELNDQEFRDKSGVYDEAEQAV